MSDMFHDGVLMIGDRDERIGYVGVVDGWLVMATDSCSMIDIKCVMG